MEKIKDIDKKKSLSDADYNPHEGHRERMRRKIDKDPDLEMLEDHEALEFRLGLVIPRKDTNKLAHELISKFGSLDAVLSATPNELFAVKEMTTSAAYMLATDLAFTRKALKANTVRNRVRVSTPSETASQMYAYFLGRKTECYSVAYLDVNYRIMKMLYRAGATGASINVDVTEIAQNAIRDGATYVILAHNHPSGNLTPSLKDLEITDSLCSLLKAAGIELADHLIFHDSAVLSFNNCGILNKFRDDVRRKTSKNISDKPESQLTFIRDLQEYMLDPKAIARKVLKAAPVNEIIKEYSSKLDSDTPAKKNEQKRDPVSLTVYNIKPAEFSEIMRLAQKEERSVGEVAATITSSDSNADETVYEIDYDDIF